MKILQVCDIFSPQTNGTRVLVAQLCKALVQSGHKVTLVCKADGTDQQYNASFGGVEVLPFRVTMRPFGYGIMPDMIGWAETNLRWFDVIHEHSFRTYANVVLLTYSQKYRIPYIIDSHGSYARLGKKAFKWFYDVAVGNTVMDNAARVVAETEENIKEYLKGGIPRWKIVLLPPPPCDVTEFETLPSKGQFRQKWELGSRKIVMSLGRIHWVKGLDFLVDSFATLAQRRVDVSLVIVGNDDGYKATLEKKIADAGLTGKVIFTGYLSGEAKKQALVDADVVVQPSRYESGVGAPVEALLCGTPIIVTQGTGSAEDVARMEAGYFVRFGDVSGLAQTIENVLLNQDGAQCKVARGKEYALSHLSMAAKVGEYEALYRECMR